MAHRGHVLAHVSKDFTGALVAFSHSVRLWPDSRSPLQEVQVTIDRLWTREIAAHPETYRRVYGVEVADGRVVPCDLPPRAKPVRDPLADIEMINEINRRNMQRMMQPPLPPTASPYGPLPGVPQPYGLLMPGQPLR